MQWIDLGTKVAVLNSQVVPISQVVLKTGFTVQYYGVRLTLNLLPVWSKTIQYG